MSRQAEIEFAVIRHLILIACSLLTGLSFFADGDISGFHFRPLNPVLLHDPTEVMILSVSPNVPRNLPDYGYFISSRMNEIASSSVQSSSQEQPSVSGSQDAQLQIVPDNDLTEMSTSNTPLPDPFKDESPELPKLSKTSISIPEVDPLLQSQGNTTLENTPRAPLSISAPTGLRLTMDFSSADGRIRGVSMADVAIIDYRPDVLGEEEGAASIRSYGVENIGFDKVIISLSRVIRIDNVGIEALANLVDHLKEKGKQIRFVTPIPGVQDRLKSDKSLGEILVFENDEAAQRSFANPSPQ
jgi:anti-anti-sigma regulatory factor